MPFVERVKVNDAARVAIVDYARWLCMDCGLTGIGKLSFRRHQEECLCKGDYEKSKATISSGHRAEDHPLG